MEQPLQSNFRIHIKCLISQPAKPTTCQEENQAQNTTALRESMENPKKSASPEQSKLQYERTKQYNIKKEQETGNIKKKTVGRP